MKKLSFILSLCTITAIGHAQQLLPNYNQQYYPTILQAAQGVGMPFLLQEQYLKQPGVTIQRDSILVYNDITYAIRNHYQNPSPGYYLPQSSYDDYKIPDQTAAIWPKQMPNALYNSITATFNSTVDCVGYGTRLMSATGGSTTTNNAYLQLITTIKANNTTPFAARGYVASAYEIAAAFPVLPATAKAGWVYVAGNVKTTEVDSLNQNNKTHKNLKHYTAVSKGGFAKALPGDVLAFGYAPGGSANGHFMVLEHAPELLTQTTLPPYFAPYQQTMIFPTLLTSLLANYNVYAVPLFDCSGQNVHFNDSRKYMSGIGHGTLLLLTDKATDTPQGFIFSPPHYGTGIPKKIGMELMSAHVVAITVGRYVGAGI